MPLRVKCVRADHEESGRFDHAHVRVFIRHVPSSDTATIPARPIRKFWTCLAKIFSAKFGVADTTRENNASRFRCILRELDKGTQQ